MNRSVSAKREEFEIVLCKYLINEVAVAVVAKMKRQDKEEKQMDRKKTLDSLCSTTGLLLSVVCCIALIHVELRMQEHHRLISHSAKRSDQMETEILRKVQQYYGRWQDMRGSQSEGHWQETKG